MSEYEFIDYALDGDVAVIRLDYPAALNALSQKMTSELNHALDRAGSEARAIVLGSSGRAFSAGANLTSGDIDINDPNRDIGRLLESEFNPMIRKMRDPQEVSCTGGVSTLMRALASSMLSTSTTMWTLSAGSPSSRGFFSL